MPRSVQPPGYSSNLPQPNPPAWLMELGYQVRQWIDNNAQSGRPTLSTEVLQYLEKIKKGPGPYPSQQDFIKALQSNFFNGVGNLDVYANSGLGSAGPVQDFMKLFGLTPPLVTPIDNLFFKFQAEVYGPGLPKGGGALLEDLHNYLMDAGSQGSIADFQKWATQEANSSAFKNASSDAQAFFKQFIQ
jgi:hypothetical protein